MDELRWILLLIGLLALGVIYLLSRNKKKGATKADRPDEEPRLDPLFDTIAIVKEPIEPALPEDFELITNPDAEPVNKPVVAKKLSEAESRSSVLSNITHDTETLNQLLSQKLSPGESPATDVVLPPIEEVEPADQIKAVMPEFYQPFVDESEQEAELVTEPEFEPVPESIPEPESDQVQVAPLEEKVISLNIVSQAGESFQGADMLRIFKSREYEYGEMDIFHSRYKGRIVFSIVNLVEPGWFDLDAMDGFTTSGFALFMQLPGPLAADVAFDVMLNEANALVEALGGEVNDTTHQPLTIEKLQSLRAEVVDYAERQQQR